MINKYWVWLSKIPNLGSKKTNQLIEIYKNPETIWNLKYEDLIQVEGIGDATAKNIVNLEYRKNLDKYLDYMNKYNIDIITIKDNIYPEKLKQIYSPPTVIYIKGNKEILNEKSIAIIGCRDCSTYGKNAAREIAYELSNKGINIISGLAKGIDSFAHIGAVQAKGKTIAVLGNGLDTVYPKENVNLAKAIIDNDGALISEYIIGTKPEKMNFPARNRIVSGLSDGVVVIEAKQRSGSLITVDFALEQGKEVYALPGNIYSKNSIGTNELIKQGAKCITNIDDILEEFI